MRPAKASSKNAGRLRFWLDPTRTASTRCPFRCSISCIAIAWVMCPRPSPCTVNITLMESYEAEVAVEVLDQRRAVLDPVPAIHVEHVVDLTNLGPVDVSADHARHPALATELEHRVFVVGHVLHRALRAQLDVRRERPVAEAEAAP